MDGNLFNNLFQNDKDIDEFKKYLTTGKNRKLYLDQNYLIKFNKPAFKKFMVENNKIYLKKPKLELIKFADIQDVLQKVYDEDNNSISKGIVSFYKYITSKYLNITRENCADFLKSQNDYQVSRPLGHHINKPIIAKYSNQMWCIDLIDMNPKKFNGFQYILNCVDVYSRYVRLEALKKKDATSVVNAMREIINGADVTPDTILSDNGTEFDGAFRTFCEEENIKLLHIPSHSPQSNGVVERANKDIRKIINGFYLKDPETNWVDVLPEVEDNKNSSYNSSIKDIPQNVWTSEKNKNQPDYVENDDGEIINNPKIKSKVNLALRAMKLIDKYKEHDNFKVGDKVRVKMSAMYSGVRKLIKEGKSKQIVVTYTPIIYSVSKVFSPTKGILERKQYVLETNDGMELGVMRKGILDVRRFYASDLQLANEDDDNNLTMDEALALNGVKANNNDIMYIDV